MSTANIQPVELILRSTTERIDILVVDADCEPIDATELSLRVLDMSNTILLQDDFFLGYGDPPGPPSQIVKPLLTTGSYYFPFGDTSFDTANTTDTLGDFLFHWQVVATAGSEEISIVQVAKIVSAQTLALLPYLRNQIDKAGKLVDDDPENPCLVGYSDSQLIQWLEGGLTAINAAQPFGGWTSLDQFPMAYRQILIESALMVGLTAQSIFAIDTDIDQYNDQGNSFSIQHHPKLMAMLQFLAAKLDKTVTAFKLNFVRSGHVYVQMGPNFRLAQLVAAAPSGALFRNLLSNS